VSHLAGTGSLSGKTEDTSGKPLGTTALRTGTYEPTWADLSGNALGLYARS